MKIVELGMSPADAESVQLSYRFGDLYVRFTSWDEKDVEAKFYDVLAFSWQEFDFDQLRKNVCYEVSDSSWLASQAKLQELNPEDYIHYKVCFNANGVLDLITLRNVPANITINPVV